VIELLTVMAILAILSSVAMYSFTALKNSARDAAQVLVNTYTQARTGAMSNTLAYRVVYDGTQVMLQSSRSCLDTDTWNTLNTTLYTVPKDVTLQSTAPGGVLVCYSPRGLGAFTADVVLTDTKNHSYTLRSYYGGATRVTSNG